MTSSAQGAGATEPMRRPCSRCGELKRRLSFSADAWRTKGDDTRQCRSCRAQDKSARGPKTLTLTEAQIDTIRRELRCTSCGAYPQPQEDGKVWTKHWGMCGDPWGPP